ncbi:GSCOCG00008007001-RA-CDS, partial [Cotesia congregata]
NKQITGFLPAYPSYVISFKSIDNLKPVIDNLQRSKFWNIKSPFVIVGTESSCLNAGRILKFMWDRDLLSVYYLCNKKNSTTIITLNPYASYAPAPWKLVDKFSDNKNKIHLFRLQFTKGPEICKIITFDKTDRLEKAEIRFVALKSNNKQPVTWKKVRKNSGINIAHVSTLINATSTMKFIPPQNSIELLKKGYIKQLLNNTCDIYTTKMPIEATDYSHVNIIAYYHEHEFSIA